MRILWRLPARSSARGSCRAEDPFFVTYTSHMEDKGTLEINSKNITGSPARRLLVRRHGAGVRVRRHVLVDQRTLSRWPYHSFARHLLHGLPLGKPLPSISRASLDQPGDLHGIREYKWRRPGTAQIEGHDGVQDLIEPVADLRLEKERELELKLILASYFNGWTLAENLIAVKDVPRGALGIWLHDRDRTAAQFQTQTRPLWPLPAGVRCRRRSIGRRRNESQLRPT